MIGLWHSGGARLPEGVLALDGVGIVFAAMVRASGRVPQISVVLGPAAGGAAYGPALTDIVIMGGDGRIFVTGPEVVRSVTGEQVDMERLGGPEPHGRRSGVVHVTTKDDASALASARELTVAARSPGPAVAVRCDRRRRPRRAAAGRDQPRVRREAAGQGAARRARRGAAREVGAEHRHHAGRFGGRTVGVIANNPLRLGGCLDSSSAEKAARFVRMCDALGVPLIVLVDVPGYLPGVGQEWDGVVRRGAKLLHAFAEAVVPRVTLVTRKSYGGAYIAMNSKSLGATAVFAWPNAEIAVMGASAAVNILHRKKLAAAEARGPRGAAGAADRGADPGRRRRQPRAGDRRRRRGHQAGRDAQADRRGDRRGTGSAWCARQHPAVVAPATHERPADHHSAGRSAFASRSGVSASRGYERRP